MQPGRGLGSVLGRLGRTTRMRLAIVLAVVLSFAYALATGAIPGVSAVFTADTGNTGAQFHGGWIDQATNPQIVVSGYGAQMSWTAGATGVAAEEIDAADGGTGAAASCPAVDMSGAWPQAPYGLVATMPTPSTVAYSDAGSAANNGHWRCYLVVGTNNGWWRPQTFAALRVGMYPVSVALNGNGSGKLDIGETVVITFNQPVDSASVVIGSGICQVKNGPLVIGFTGTCSAASVARIGSIPNLAIGKTGTTAATVSVVGAVVTVRASGGGQNISGTGTFTASASITSSTGGAGACTASFCQVTGIVSGF